MVSPFTKNALYSLWQLIAYKYVCADSQLFFFQQLVSAVGFSVYSTVDRRTGKRRMDGHRMMAYTACTASRGKNRHFYIPQLHFFVCPGDAPVAITQNVA